jgi:hypothetical protein
MSALRITIALCLLAGCSNVEVDCPSLSKEGCWDEAEECRWSGDYSGCLHVCSGQADCESGLACENWYYQPEVDGPEATNAFTYLCIDKAWLEEETSQ